MRFKLTKQTYISIWLSAGLLLLTLNLIPLSGFAQGNKLETLSPISIEVEVTPKQATVGDLITYSIRVRHDLNIEPSSPDFVPPDGLEMVDQGTRELARKKIQVQREFWFRVRADLVGSYEFPALPISFILTTTDTESKKIPGQVASPKAQVEIQSILHLQGEPKDIRDIKPLENIERNWLPIVLGVLAVLLALALGFFLFFKNRKKLSPESGSKQEILSPQEIALRDLDILQIKGLLEKGLVREYYFELSEIFRRYLGASFKFPALDWTTEEIKHFLARSSSLSKEQSEKIIFILENTDLVKFAKAQMTGDENMTERIIIFIQETSRPWESEAPSQPVCNDAATLS
jgi:hypothetical protein